MTHRHFRRVLNIVKRGGGACIVCKHAVVLEEYSKAVVVVLDNTLPETMANFGLRHSHCTKSKYRPLIDPAERDLVKLIEAMIESKDKLCILCKKTWSGLDPEYLVLVEVGITKRKEVAHLVCVGGPSAL